MDWTWDDPGWDEDWVQAILSLAPVSAGVTLRRLKLGQGA